MIHDLVPAGVIRAYAAGGVSPAGEGEPASDGAGLPDGSGAGVLLGAGVPMLLVAPDGAGALVGVSVPDADAVGAASAPPTGLGIGVSDAVCLALRSSWVTVPVVGSTMSAVPAASPSAGSVVVVRCTPALAGLLGVASSSGANALPV